MKRLLRYKITGIVTLVVLLIQVRSLLPDLPRGVQWLAAGGIVLGSWYVEHSKSAPVIRLQDRRKALFARACEDAMTTLRRYDPGARLNIMEIDSLYFRRLSHFNIIYDLHVSKNDPDRGMRMNVTQGVCGQAAQSGDFCVGDISNKKGPPFGLTAEQQQKVKDVRLVLSMPIFKVVQDAKGEAETSSKVIGVVNIDSKRKDAPRYYETHKVNGRSLLEHQEEALRQISEYCSYVMS